MSSSRERILTRLRAKNAVMPLYRNPLAPDETDWLKQQPPIDDLAARFTAEQQAVGGEVRAFDHWDALAAVLPVWLQQHQVRSVITGTEPRLAPLTESLQKHGGFTLRTYDRPLEEQKEDLFQTDCGITTSRGGIAETGSVILVPTPEEPRLLSLSVSVHLVVVEKDKLLSSLSEFVRTGEYQEKVPTNLVLVSGASRTADIELILVVGVHGPRIFLVAVVG